MKQKSRSREQIIEEQIQRWRLMQIETLEEKIRFPTITISREPGSGGSIVANKLAGKLEFDLFHQEILHEMAQKSQVSAQILKTLDEKGLSVLEDWITSLVQDRHLWPDQYLKQLMKVVVAIGKHSRAIIVGRGANFILPPDDCIKVRIISPQRVRIQNVAKTFKISEKEAKRRVIRTESDRRAFVRKYFNAEIADPVNYDIVINTGTLSMDRAVSSIAALAAE